jgi:hypothetical protein
MRRGALLALASLTTLALASCEGRSAAASRSPGASASPTLAATAHGRGETTATVAAASAAPTPLSSVPVKDIILVRSLGIDAPFTETSCTDSSLLTVVPSGATILYADCGTYWRFVASVSGPLKPVLSAPAGTAFEWTNAASVHFAKVLNASRVTVSRDSTSGQYPGHGIPPGAAPARIQLRNGTQQTELTAT